ncbi:DnaJ domain containing protein [Melia azedarach]|uniref:DnaJ domain containing protein n=1 Tax=Melia azedarach TaxID=155640 RepID=A0ACC1YHY0_MELAZ|nr:DnaJ domain containing protein [Melia azedarach]
MECNKEEAIRAKGIAEKKMQNNDFAGARKIALKAQQLYNELENISQMIMVCDVHCCAENKLLGNEMDWYGILQIEQTANEDMIKKQYRKFALQLHPDKNKFPGAEIAFKLIVEAQRVLLDKGKRSLHDLKRKASMSRSTAQYQPPPMPTYSNVGTRNNFRSTFTGLNFQHQKVQQTAQQGASNSGPTFWTMCPFCTVRYQYYRKVINKSIICQACNKPFVAYERGEQGIPLATSCSQPAFRQQKDVPSQGPCKVEPVFKGNVTADNPKMAFSQETGYTSGFGKEKVNGRRGRKQVVESSESCNTESSTESEVDMAVDASGDFQGGENFGRNTDQYPRRSSRCKQQVSYNENLSDDDLLSHPKRAKGGGSSCATENENGYASREQVPKMDKQSGSAATVKEEQKSSFANDCKKGSGTVADGTPDSNSESTEEPEFYDYPDQDFHDFDKDRKEECFRANQTWAIYDTLDAMPRFYARIRKVFPSGFKLRITWLEPDPDDEKEIEWVNKGLPLACGKFKHGNSENTENHLMFSHLVSFEKGRRRDTYKIYPKKGQIWGLFKSWDFNWISDADTNRNYDYEFVEILSDYADGVGTSVAYLAKVKGFASVFCRKGNKGIDSVQIPPSELFRFSHRVPSFKLTSEEKEGLLKGSFELDLASLPQNLEEIDVPEILKAEAGSTHSNCSVGSSDKEKPAMGSEGCSSMHWDEVKEAHLEPEDDILRDNVARHSAPSSSIPEAIEIPEPDFFNFDAEKSEEKLQIGQIWSLYCDEDGLPKYYGKIVRIVSEPVFKLHLRWLESCSLPNNSIRWHDKDMPISCGRFKIKKSEIQKYTSTESFSHQVRAEFAGKNEFTILPRKGEVWALYKNWNAYIKCSDLENCEYDIVEILDADDLHIEVLYLERLDSFNSVFKPQEEGTGLMKISLIELLRFSHQIPAFKLTEERDGNLKGFWELDPAALPVHYFSP